MARNYFPFKIMIYYIDTISFKYQLIAKFSHLAKYTLVGLSYKYQAIERLV